MNTLLHALEQSAFDAWPALEQREHAGWALRFANGYTRRANSANALAQTDSLTDDQIDAVERFYQARSIPPIFRLASFCTGTQVDNTLADRGYRFADLSLVMTAPLAEHLEQRDQPIAGLLPDAAAWLAAYQSIKGDTDGAARAHLEMLQAIRGDCAFAVAPAAGGPVCCGLGVVTGEHLGLFEIATQAGSRRQGLARRLCRDLMAWGESRGARTAYLQVVASNHSAIRVYEDLGYRRRYHYWYRVR